MPRMSYANQIEARLGGLTRRQALAATPEHVMYEILDARAKNSRQFELAAPH
jgi:hypothetical protein